MAEVVAVVHAVIVTVRVDFTVVRRAVVVAVRFARVRDAVEVAIPTVRIPHTIGNIASVRDPVIVAIRIAKPAAEEGPARCRAVPVDLAFVENQVSVAVRVRRGNVYLVVDVVVVAVAPVDPFNAEIAQNG